MATRKTAAESQSTNDAAKMVEETASAMNEAAKTGAAQFEANVAKANEQVEQARSAVMKSYEDLAVVGKENFDAVVESGNIVAKGVETFSKQLMALAQSSMQANAETAKAMTQAKSLSEVFDLQSSVARKTFDQAMSESAKLTEMGVKVANEASEPLTKRVNVTIEAMMKPASTFTQMGA